MAEESKELIEAVKNNNIEVVKKRLDDGADVNTIDKFGASILHLSTFNGYLELTRLLLRSSGTL